MQFAFGQGVEEVPPLFAQRGEQGVAGLAQIGVVGVLQHLRRFDDVAPVFGRRVEGEDVYFAVLGNGLQQLQVHGGECGDAEYEQSLGQLGSGRGECVEQFVPQGDAVRCDLPAVVEETPQFGLPDFVFAQADQTAVLPGIDPVGAVNQILVENIGKLPGELVGGDAAAGEVGRQRLPRGRIFGGGKAV